MASNVRETYTQASIAGCEFDIISTSDERGNRLAVHEYPERDTPFVESLGRRLRVFRISAAVRGDDHIRLSKEIIDKCECGDILPLVHPFYGDYEVKCASVTVENDNLRARETILSFEFYEAGEFVYPSLGSQAGRATQSVVVNYTNTVFNTLTLTGSNLPSVFSFVKDIATVMRGIYSRSILWGDATVDIDGLLLQMEATPAQFTDESFSDIMRQAIEGLYANAISGAASVSALCELLNYGVGLAAPVNEYALKVRLMVIGWAATAALDEGYTNPSEALSFMECLIGILERDGALAASLCYDDIYAETLGLISTISQDFRALSLGLPPVITRKLCGSLPSLVAAYEVFGNLDTHDDFVSLNSSRSCFFMPENVLYQAQ